MSDALDEIRKKYFTEVPADPDAPKVFHIFTRAPYEPPPAEDEIEEVAPDAVDEEALKVATGLAEDFEQGLCRGIAAIVWNEADKVFEAHVSLPIGLSVADGAARMLGSLKVLERSLTDLCEGKVEVLSRIDSPTAAAFEASDQPVFIDLDAEQPDDE
ncbi:hypothetical protein [Methylorubrum extorquens]|uniref:hypothetical protein n=1 Tax=Methylorubrum extorquens TaxID=408 RepID=UPI00209E22C3|nr:hypothetical protein [Methylorubrum extorquens]MCP1540077.1 hypothetical protein [Methylorubrum extorquens]